MSFMLKEQEHTPYGAEILGRIMRIDSVDAIVSDVERLNAQAGGEAFIWIAGEECPIGLISIVSCQGGLTINTTPEGQMPSPVSAVQFVKGLQIEAHGNKSQEVFVKLDGETRAKKLAAARLERLDSDGPLYIITFELGEYADIRVSKAAETAAPCNSDDIRAGLARLMAASRRPNLPEELLLCHIPSVRSKYISREEIADAAGTMCVVDVVRKKENHLEIDLMSVAPSELERMQENPGDQSAGAVASRCAGFGEGLPLFFIYMGKPYAASEFKVENGTPSILTLEPWADVDEDDGSEEIRMLAAKQMADGLI